ncbi:MAG: hypothetical protein ACTHOE_05235 [Conexibacter sp.]
MSTGVTIFGAASMSLGSQSLLATEIALLVAAVGALVTLERALEQTWKAQQRRTTPRPAIVTALVWGAGAAAAAAAPVGVVALVTGRLHGWEKAAISVGLVLVMAAIAATTVSLLHARSSSATSGGVRWAAAAMLLAIGVTIAFVVVRSEPAPASGVTFVVYGTCLSHGCGLKQRSGPGPEYREAGPRLRDGTEVTIVCRARGNPIPGHRSHLWDRLSDGLFVSDAFIDRPKDGRPPYIAWCDPHDYAS